MIKSTRSKKSKTRNPNLSPREERILELEKRLAEAKEKVKEGVTPGSTLGLILYGEIIQLRNFIDDLNYMTDEEFDDIKRKIRKNPSRVKNPSPDFKTLQRKLIHLLTAYDQKLSKRQPNIHRLSHYFRAVDNAFDKLPDNASIEDLKRSLNREFIVSDMPPVKKFINELEK